MTNKTNKTISPITLNNGVTLPTRFGMAPMVAAGSTYEGMVTDDDVNYFLRRAKIGSLLITGATNVGPQGNAFGYGLSAETDEHIPGLKRLAQAMQYQGNKALLQIYHPGRQAIYSYQDEGVAYGPSSQEPVFLDYPVTGMTDEQVTEFLEYFARATKRAIEAGFDGVEIHGANHYLIQQFFSKLSNEREDEWGGGLEGRAQFPLAVVDAVKAEVAKHNLSDFIIGYRISPEEVHGPDIGYDLEDSLYLIDQVVERGVDYIHTSIFGPEGYKKPAQSGKYQGQIINQAIREMINGRTALMGAGDITSQDKAVDALNYLDLLALGSAAIVDPDFQEKIINGHPQDISMDAADRIDDLALPARFYRMANTLLNNKSVPEETVKLIRAQKPAEDEV